MSSVQCFFAIWKINNKYIKSENYNKFMKCVHLIVSGKVQGVFFRDNTRRKAIELGLKGYAKNLPDGTAEVIAQGDENKINELIQFIKNSPGASNVEGVKARHKEPENFKGFDVLH